MTNYPNGTRVRTLIVDMDLDEHDNERSVPAGTVGTIRSHTDDLYNIVWDNGAWTRWTEEELIMSAEVVTGE